MKSIPKIKLCGLCSMEDIDCVNRLKPDFAGFVFAQGSRRQVTGERARAMRERLNPSVQSVGVFVDEEIGTVLSYAEEGIIDLIQLHGREDESYLAELRKQTKAPLIRAFRIASKEDVKEAAVCSADYILLDSGAGTGQSFDWSFLKGVNRPYFLAGGLTPDNVSEALIRLRPFGVDVSSGIEREGRKDPEKMKAFVEEARKGFTEGRENL